MSDYIRCACCNGTLQKIITIQGTFVRCMTQSCVMYSASPMTADVHLVWAVEERSVRISQWKDKPHSNA